VGFPCLPLLLLQASELATAKRTLQELVGRMFAGPAWRVSPRQNELADAMRALEGQVAEVRALPLPY